MKVTVPEHQSKITLSTLLLELQLTNELEQLSSAISVYQELISFCLQYAFLFKNEDSAPIGELFSQNQERLSTPDPARDGTNWVVYCAANPVGRWDPSGCWSQEYDKYVLHGNTDNQYNGTVPNTPGNPAGSTSSTTSCSNASSSSSSTKVETPTSTWNDKIEPAITNTFWEVTTGLFNCDFGVDSFIKAGYAWNNGQYIKALLDSTNGIGEAVLDCLFIYDTAATYGPWIEAAVLNIQQKLQTEIYSAESVNEYFTVQKGLNPPYKPGTSVSVYPLAEDTTFVRVYDGINSRMKGSWLMKAEDISGLSASQIQEKFALPSLPKFMCDVELKKGDLIRTGIVNPLFGFSGGGIQYDTYANSGFVGVFSNERLIPQ